MCELAMLFYLAYYAYDSDQDFSRKKCEFISLIIYVFHEEQGKFNDISLDYPLIFLPDLTKSQRRFQRGFRHIVISFLRYLMEK